VILLDKEDMGKIEESPIILYIEGHKIRKDYFDHLSVVFLKAVGVQNSQVKFNISNPLK